jgi:hypothetical protein
MKKVCLSGDRDDAKAIQERNGVAVDFCGPWYHGSGNRRINTLDNQHGKFTWLTRSPAGGISWGPTVLTVYVVAPLDELHLTDAGAGDDGGTNPSDPKKKLPKWWLKVNTAEIDKLMVVSLLDRDSTSGVDFEETLLDAFYVNLKNKMAEIGRTQ